jgi:hypothetical protein
MPNTITAITAHAAAAAAAAAILATPPNSHKNACVQEHPEQHPEDCNHVAHFPSTMAQGGVGGLQKRDGKNKKHQERRTSKNSLKKGSASWCSPPAARACPCAFEVAK